MMKINVYSEKSGNFASDSKMKPMIIIESKKKTLESLKAQYPDAMIIDVTSHAQDEFVKFSPFYPNGGIPVPFTDDIAVSVEGIWQGLKVFEDADVDTSFFSKRDIKARHEEPETYCQKVWSLSRTSQGSAWRRTVRLH